VEGGLSREQRAESIGQREIIKFRFEDLEIWQLAIEIADELFDIADKLEKEKLFRFAEQLRGAAMSISNNIAEGSGSDSNREFAQFLNIARRSVFENANILMILYRRKLISEEKLNSILKNLDYLCRKITNFKRTLRSICRKITNFKRTLRSKG